MLILSIDSSGSNCSVCIWRDGTVLSQISEQMERGQDQRLIPLVLYTLKQANTSFDQLDRIAVTRGPGSFTGLRIGLAAARGMGLAADKPVIGIDRFSIFREQIKQPNKNLLVIINSKRKELFCQFYFTSGSISEPTMMSPEEIQIFLKDNPETIITGDVLEFNLPNFLPATEPEVVTCALLASNAAIDDQATLARPLYIRPPDVTVAAHKSDMESVRG